MADQRLPGGGWIRVHRSLLENPLWSGERFTRGQAWVDLLLRARHSEGVSIRGNSSVAVKRGQVLTSQVELAKQWLWNRETVSRFLDMLNRLQMVSFETSKRTDTGYTLITVLNYEKFQGQTSDTSSILSSKASDTRSSIDPASTQHRAGTYKNEKKEKKKTALSWGEYLTQHDPEGQEVLIQTASAIARTRKTGLVAPSVLDGFGQRLCDYPVEAVLRACQIYLDHDYAGEGKNERYLVGIVRHEARRANLNGGPPDSVAKTEGQLAIERTVQEMAAERGP